MRLAAALSACLLIVACSGDKNDSPSSPTSPTPVASAPAPLWTAAGTGNDVFSKPLSATRLRITGSYQGSSSNFIVRCDADLLVNEIIGTFTGRSPTYTGVHAAPSCSTIEIRNSTGVSWTLTEVR